MTGSARVRTRAAVVVFAVAALIAGLVPPAGANHLPIQCEAVATITHVQDPITGIVSWTVAGAGTCGGDFHGTYLVDVTGTGTSGNLGLCDSTSPELVDLRLFMTVTLKSTSTGASQVLLNRWFAPFSTFPIATPFLIDRDWDQQGEVIGGGVIFTRIFGQCPPEGTPASRIVWTQTH